MAIVTAVKSGNWSDTTVWDSNPALPGPGDVVRPATFAVAIDQDVAVAELNGLTAGHSGYFTVAAAPRTIVADIKSGGADLLRLSHATGLVTITGDVTGGARHAITFTGTGSITINGNITGGSGYFGVYSDWSGVAGTLTVNGNVTAGPVGPASGVYSGGKQMHYVINGDITAHPTGANAYGAVLYGALSVTVDGDVQGGAEGPGVLISFSATVAGYVIARGSVSAAPNGAVNKVAAGIMLANGGRVYAYGPLNDSVNGVPAVMGGTLIRSDAAFRSGAIMARVDDDDVVSAVKVPLIGAVVTGGAR
jgi:hypothetical protein